MNMRERLARAIAIGAGHADADRMGTKMAPYCVDGIRYESPMQPCWVYYTNQADAVLDMLAEPTEEMVEAGRWPAEDDGPLACWRAMIQSAREGK